MKHPASVIASSESGVPAGLGEAGPGRWLRERIWLVDLLVVAGVFLYTLPMIRMYVTGPVSGVGLLLVSFALCAPYLLRRRCPLSVLGLMLVAACIQLLLGAWILPADAMLLFAVYNVATRYGWWVSFPGAVATVGWLLVAVAPRLSDDVLNVGQLGVLVVVTFWVWTWGTLVRIRRQHIAGLRERAEQAERERESRARIAVADERARIAREIHDVVSHGLSVVVVLSDGAAAKVETDPERARAAMVTVRDTGRVALADMRRMLGVLRDDEPGSHSPQPGITQIDGLIEGSRRAGLPVTLTVEGDPVTLPESLELTIYRLVQESLTNVRKHAGTEVTRVEVLLRYRASPNASRGEVEVNVVDDGRGPDVSPSSAPAGLGQAGMRERVVAHGGAFSAGPGASGGFAVVAVLPVEGES